MSRVFGCALIAVLALALAAPAQADRSIERFLDATLPHGTSGTAVAVRDGRIVHCEGFGRGGSCDTVYDLMSMTKQFTAAAILKLEMQGRLRTSDPMERYVGPVPEDKRAITLHQLLTHTSGLTEGLGDDYDVLSREQFLAAHLLRPAGMTQTGYVLPAWRRGLVAVEYDERGRSRGRPFDHPWAADGPYWNLRGNGGLLSTARDMVRWHRALEGDAILSRRAKRKLFKPRVPIPAVEGYEGFRAAYGWAVSRTASGRMVTHSGGNGWSYGVVARFLDEGVMVFWISNRATRAGRWDLQALARKLTLGISART
jgi:CubicO group peptidase (beta-lactamase class C family)